MATKAMLSALLWLKNRNGDGVFDRYNVLTAGGEKSPVMRSTWSKLESEGLGERYLNNRRFRLTDKAHQVDLKGVEESA